MNDQVVQEYERAVIFIFIIIINIIIIIIIIIFLFHQHCDHHSQVGEHRQAVKRMSRQLSSSYNSMIIDHLIIMTSSYDHVIIISSTYDHVMTWSYEWWQVVQEYERASFSSCSFVRFKQKTFLISGCARVRASSHLQTWSAPWRGSQGTRWWSPLSCSQKINWEDLDSNDVVLENLDSSDVILREA